MGKNKRDYKANRCKQIYAEGGTRTHTSLAGKRILSPPRLPFRHLGMMVDSLKRRRADSNRRIGVLQTPALTSWLHRHNYQICWSGRRDSNPRPLPWQGSILPLNYFRLKQILPSFISSRKQISPKKSQDFLGPLSDLVEVKQSYYENRKIFIRWFNDGAEGEI